MLPKYFCALTISCFLAAAISSNTATLTGIQQPVTFSLKTLNGQNVTSAGLRGKTVVLAFGATWLPLSKAQLEGIKQIGDDYANRGVVIYWISTDSENSKSKNFASDDQIKTFAVKSGISAPVLRDPDNTVAKQFGINQLPAVVIIDRSGNMVENPLIGLDPNRDLSEQIAPILERALKNG